MEKTLGHEHFMKAALEEARKAFAKDEVPIGAVVVYKDEIIGRGHNLRETLADPTAHAEILALREAGKHLGDWRLEDCLLYVTIEPCPMCAGAIQQARVSTVVYGAKDAKAGAIDSLIDIVRDGRFNHQVKVVGNVMANEAAQIMKYFFKRLR